VVHALAAAQGVGDLLRAINDAEGAEAGLVINFFWIFVAAANFLVFLLLAWYLGFRSLSRNLDQRRERIEQGLRDADQARQEREKAASERLEVLSTARQEANEILTRAQHTADENRERDMAETRAELERLRERAAADIEAEKQRALADVREQVAELALLAAGRVVGETMNEPRERRLVEEFLQQVGDGRRASREN
jgi:F-type H+-transporting ATPase subunit b